MMWISREYWLHSRELSELINLDKSWNWWANVGTRWQCHAMHVGAYRASDYFFHAEI